MHLAKKQRAKKAQRRRLLQILARTWGSVYSILLRAHISNYNRPRAFATPQGSHKRYSSNQNTACRNACSLAYLITLLETSPRTEKPCSTPE